MHNITRIKHRVSSIAHPVSRIGNRLSAEVSTKAEVSKIVQTSRKSAQIRNKNMQNKANFKNDDMNVSTYTIKGCETFRPFSRRKNKANQSQFKPNFSLKLALFFPKLALIYKEIFAFAKKLNLRKSAQSADKKLELFQKWLKNRI